MCHLCTRSPLEWLKLVETRRDALCSVQGGGGRCAVYATVHATDDYLQWASNHCAGTPATVEGDMPMLPCARGPAQPKPAHRLRQSCLLRLRHHAPPPRRRRGHGHGNRNGIWEWTSETAAPRATRHSPPGTPLACSVWNDSNSNSTPLMPPSHQVTPSCFFSSPIEGTPKCSSLAATPLPGSVGGSLRMDCFMCVTLGL